MNYIAHHGIKGQRWGVRRFQNEDGTLTASGKNRYRDPNKKSKVRARLEEKYMSNGMSKKDAEELAAKKIKTAKILAGVGAAAVTAAAVTYLVTKHKAEADKIINSGDMLQRIQTESGTDLHDVFYASKNKRDNTRYLARLGLIRKAQGDGTAYKLGIEATDNMRIAGDKSARRIFNELYKNDSNFRMEAMGYLNKPVGSSPSRADMKKMYNMFNRNGLIQGKGESGAGLKFVNALKKAGYSGVSDWNDRSRDSIIKAKNPLILFNEGKNFAVKTVDSISGKDIKRAFVKDILIPNNIEKKVYKLLGAGGVGALIAAKKTTSSGDD